MHKFTINRKTWLRGARDGDSYLLRESDGKRCCLGFYLHSCGVADDDIAGWGTPSSVTSTAAPISGWLLDGNGQLISDDCALLIGANDAPHSDEPEREAEIVAMFAKHGIEVSFTDGEP